MTFNTSKLTGTESGSARHGGKAVHLIKLAALINSVISARHRFYPRMTTVCFLPVRLSSRGILGIQHFRFSLAMPLSLSKRCLDFYKPFAFFPSLTIVSILEGHYCGFHTIRLELETFLCMLGRK